jgi:ribonuclease HII
MSMTYGIDEAGRGCLVGSVYAACVYLPPNFPTKQLNDSKKLSAKQRNELYHLIYASAMVGVGWASAQEIDQLNILQATLLAMQRAYHNMSDQATLVLVDGNKAPNLPVPIRTIVKGDSIEPCIMAASIIAKVSRDAHMDTLHQMYPVYGFDQHKGYATKKHYQALQQHGACPEHRRSFRLFSTENCLTF